MNFVLILLIGLANCFYANLCIQAPDSFSFLGMLAQTFLVGIFPLSFLSLIQYNRLLTSNTRASQEINISEELKSSHVQNLNSKRYYYISEDQGKTSLDLNDLLFLESDGNYAHMHSYSNGHHTKTIHRTTLKSLENENTYPNVMRCHRSYIVNLDHVVEVSGNAQGLKLALKNSNIIVPVSRKYIPSIKNYFKSS